MQYIWMLIKNLTEPTEDFPIIPSRIRSYWGMRHAINLKNIVGKLLFIMRWLTGKIKSLGDLIKNKHVKDTKAYLWERVIEAQEKERKRIARDLHDHTGQLLVALKLGLKAVDEANTMKEVHAVSCEMNRLVDQAINEVRDLAVQLRPSVLDDYGIEAALEEYVRRTYILTNKKITYISCGLNGTRFSPPMEITVYRIVQEAVLNSIKHAQAENITITLTKKGKTLIANIVDDGCGFDVKQFEHIPKGDRLGIFGMRERALLVGGKLHIKSTPGKGTSVYLKVPLER